MDTQTPATTPSEALATLIAQAAEAEILSKAVFSKAHDKTVSRVTLTLKRVKGEILLQQETLRVADVADTRVNGKKPVQASQENIASADARPRLASLVLGFDQINLLTTAGSCELRRSKGGKETLLGATPIRKALEGGSDKEPVKITVGGNDKVKRRILTGSEPFLTELGISDEGGRVHDKKQAKFRQINRFLELTLAWVIFIFYAAQFIYNYKFHFFFSAYSMGNGGQVLEFWQIILHAIVVKFLYLLAMLLPLLFLSIFGCWFREEKTNRRPLRLLLILKF